ncbi:MAG: carboxyl transferase domain-containing protein [Lachnospiraceae bacterium]|nr:carboxyl transferase domain-containing protein [Lachnospiraceae bacterium]
MSNTSQAGNRINSLLDENSFVEIGALVSARATDFNMNPKEAPADGVVTGYGQIDGKLVYVFSQDSSVLGGSVGEMHAKKIVKLYDLAMKTGAPVIGIIDSTGIRLKESTDALNALGRIFQRQAMASGVIPQIAVVLGNCGGGLATMAEMADFVVMEDKKAKLFSVSPNTIEGNYEEKLDTAAAAFNAEAGNVDIVCDAASVNEKVRELVSMLPSNNEDFDCADECTDDLNRVCTNIAGYGNDAASIVTMIADNNVFVETKAEYAKSMVTGFIKLNGSTVGVVANAGEEKKDNTLGVKGCKKASDFVNFCDAFEIPVVSFTSAKTLGACMTCAADLAKATAKLAYTFANATVPKVNVIYGPTFGSAYTVMNSKALGCDMTFAWEGVEIGAMDAKLASKIVADGNDDEYTKAVEEFKGLQNSADSAARRGYVDTIINADDTRKYVIGALDMLFTKREERPLKKHGAV